MLTITPKSLPRHRLAALIALFVALSGPASAQSITAITAIPQAGNNIFKNLGHGLQVATICHDGGSVRIAFQNLGSDDATLNWWYGMLPTRLNRQDHLPAWSTRPVSESTRTVSLCALGMSKTSGLSACRSKGSSSSRTTKATPPSACTPSTAPRSVKFGAPLYLRRTNRV
jgi:hypothetical protein